MSKQQAILIAQETSKAVMAALKGYDVLNDSFKAGSIQKVFRDSFVGTSLDTTKWSSVIGTGGAVLQAAGALTVGSGTTINAETYVMSKETFTVPFRVSVGIAMSQRINNQSLYLEAVSVDPITGNPDNKNAIAILFDGALPNTAKYVTKSGNNQVASAGVTFQSTASSALYELEAFINESWFHGGTIDATSQRVNSYKKQKQSPDPNAVYKLRLRWINGGTAPASNTNAVLDYLVVEDYNELTAEITSGRGQSTAGNSIGTYVTGGSLNVSGLPALAAGASVIGSTIPSLSTSVGGATTFHKLTAGASTNLTSVKASAGVINGGSIHNVTAAVKYFKLYNKASAPVLATDVPIHTIPIPANGYVSLADIAGATGIRLATGIAYAITGAAADTDTTALVAGDVLVNMSYA